MKKPFPFLLGLLGLLATSRPGAAQRLVTAMRPSSAVQHYSDDFPGQVRPAEGVAETLPVAVPEPVRSDTVAATDLEFAHLQHIKNKVALGVPLNKSERLFLQLWKLRFPGGTRLAK